MAVWHSSEVQKNLGPLWVFDGNRLAWCASLPPSLLLQLMCSRCGKPQEALTLHVNMDKEKGRPDTGKNIHRFQIRKAKTMDLYPLQAYMAGQIGFDASVLEAISKSCETGLTRHHD